ncbi:hypothetical protein [Vibrio sp. SCSIO 43137]|uniref:hypothetical protein n=1 Tax=Vibrio sp. SCSIO 43137 TaxID=3021011 RepID=UPI00230731A3|nr:hypothetical protein [Vibrio sp. SCSIO 43137]WCE32522.1 hypothetical protein PK654_18700 [Vibrio sp. SCSIO 43137]
MNSEQKLIAVISGDIVNSTKLSAVQYEQLLRRIKYVQQLISEKEVLNAHSIYRGDEFQSVIHDIENALRYTIAYRVGIKALGKGFDCRISFAIAANADLREQVSESMGQAFVLSGRGLKELKSNRMLFSSEFQELNEQFELYIQYLDKQISDLTLRQCEVMLPMLMANEEISVSKLAEQLDIAIATASKSLKASGWGLIRELNEKFVNKVIGLRND